MAIWAVRLFSEEQTLAETNRLLKEFVDLRGRPRALEAGCGRRTHIHLGQAFIVGIDIEPAEIGRNGRLDETLVGDIQNYAFEPCSFDVAVCWNVLEHLEYPVGALENMRDALRPGGLLVLGVPDTRSLKTVAVKLTPRRLHEHLYHWLYPHADPNDSPFPVILSDSMSLQSLDRYAYQHAMTTVYRRTYESALQEKIRRRLHFGERRWSIIALGTRVLSAGRIDARHSDAVMILRKD